jgi:hypothetical protein
VKPNPRVWLLGLLALLLIAAYAPGMAAAQGPFWRHRAVGEKGNGVKIAASEPEGVGSVPTEAFFKFLVGKTEVSVISPSLQVKGIIYNNALQGQAKLILAFAQPKVVSPSNCSVLIGQNNTIKVYGHLAWSWNGEKKELEEQPQKEQKPDWIFTGQELQQGAKELPKELPVYTLTLSGGSCLVAGTSVIRGNYAAAIEPPNVEEWSTTETQIFLESGAKQHFWNGKENIGAETDLTLNGLPITHVGEIHFKTTGRQGGAAQEVARFES